MEWLKIVEIALTALAAVAPAAAAALTGGQTVPEALAAARSSLKALPVRSGEGGTWDVDLAARKARGEEPGE